MPCLLPSLSLWALYLKGKVGAISSNVSKDDSTTDSVKPNPDFSQYKHVLTLHCLILQVFSFFS